MKPEITYYKNGQIESKEWKNEAGQLWVELWYVNGVRHRLDDTAYQFRNKNGQVVEEAWYINGVKYETEAEFLVAVDLYKANEIAELF